MGRAAVLPHNFPHLQNLIKRDPASYREEFNQQYEHFKSSFAIIQLRPAVPDEPFEELVTFLSHVSPCYPDAKAEFPPMIMEFLSKDATTMNPSLRKCLVKCILLVRKHSSIELVRVLELFFRLFKVQDKVLREFLYESIVGEIRRANKPHKNNALNKALQNFMFGLFEEMSQSVAGSNAAGASEEEGMAVNKILQIAIELYRKGVWNDARTVNVVADAALRRVSTKVLTTALNFFIGRFKGKSLDDGETGNSSDSEADEGDQYRDLQFRSQVNGSKRSSEKKIKKALNALHRREKRQGNASEKGNQCFAAIQLLNDPQGFAEKLFGHLKKSTDPFDVKLLLMNVISRVIGSHQLIVLDYYSLLLRYIQPHQKEVTKILAYAAQASHELVPGDVLEPLIKAIAHNFAAEFCANEVIAAGLNGMREICARCPSALSGELLQDLSQFKGYHDKGVVMAARSLIALYRDINPELLHRRDRGKDVSIAMKEGRVAKPKSYGINKLAHLDATQVNDNDQVSDISGEDYESDEETIEGDFGSDDDEVEYDSQDDLSDDDEDQEMGGEPVAKKVKVDIVKLSMEKILNPKEFAQLRRKANNEAELADEDDIEVDVDSKQDDASEDDDDEEYQDPSIVNPNSLESSKKKKNSYEERMASIQAGREGRLKYGSRKGKHNQFKSVTNALKQKKNKNVQMMSHKPSVRAKKRRSLKETQKALMQHRKNQRKLRK